MGASASAPAELDRAKARALVGAGWNEETEKRWAELCGEGSTVSLLAAAEVAKELKLQIVDMRDAVATMRSAAIDMEDSGVRAMIKLAGKSAKLGHLNELFRQFNNPEVISERRERAIREEFFVSHRGISDELEKWWEAASLFFDDNWDDFLSKDEYAKFHERLLRLMREEDEMTKEEAQAALDADFEVDAGEDGRVSLCVSHEEFRYAMFQLADHWTTSLDAREYVDFLRSGYDVVFADLIAADHMRPPEEWRKALKGFKGKSVALVKTALGPDACIEIISDIYASKLVANAAKENRGKARACPSRNGGLHDALRGRVRPYTTENCAFMMDFFRDLQPVVDKILGEQTLLDTKLQKALRNKKVASHFGFLMADDVEPMIVDRLRAFGGVDGDAPLFQCIHFAFQAVCQVKEVDHHGQRLSVKLCTAIDALTFVGTVAGAVDVIKQSAKDGEVAAAPKTIGHVKQQSWQVAHAMSGRQLAKGGGEDELRAPETTPKPPGKA
ncbi:hypothetical protein JL721_4638 [Aureococcus anophagefferens]|nr:hypothetical protein JL721_4638 [Aureococcus anophagefferens]